MSNNFAKIASGVNFGSLASDPVSAKAGDFYYNSTFNKFRNYNGTVWHNVGTGSGSGAGGVNFVSNGDFEDGVVIPFSTYADAAGPTPVDGTGGSPLSTLTINNSNPISGTYDAIFSKPNSNQQGEGFSVDVTVDRARMNTLVEVDFDYQVGANFVTGPNSDLRIFIYDIANTTFLPLDVNYINVAGIGHFTAKFQSSGSSVYRLIFHIATTNALAWTFEVDNIYLGSLVTFVQGSVDRDYQYLVVPSGVYAPGSLNFPITPKASALYRIDIRGTTEVAAGVYNWNLEIDETTTAVRISGSGQQIASSAGVVRTSPISLSGTFLLTAGVAYNFTIGAGGSGDIHFLGDSAWEATQITPDISPVSLSQKISLSQLISQGTQVTGVAPSQYGQYRALYRSSGTPTSFADCSGIITPTLIDGFLFYANVPGSTAGTASQPTILQVFIGFNKSVKVFAWNSTAKTTPVDISHQAYQQTETGVIKTYDPQTGILTLDGNFIWNPAVSSRYAALLGYTDNADSATGAVYIDAEISDNPIGLGASSSRLQKSNSSGVFQGSPNVDQFVTDGVSDLQVVVNCDGGDVEIFLQGDGSLNPSGVTIDGRTNIDSDGEISFWRDGVKIENQEIHFQDNISVNIGTWPPSCFRFVDTPPPGVHTYKVSFYYAATSQFDNEVAYCKLCARLMG